MLLKFFNCTGYYPCVCIQQPGTQMWIPEMHKIQFNLGIFNTIAEHTIILNFN